MTSAAETLPADRANRAIAQSLFLTVKTIETHLGAAYDKLGIRFRHLLAEALRAGAEPAPPV
jgi:DNA-binding NarL/FixJ family response regulator